MRPTHLPEFVRNQHFREYDTRTEGRRLWKFVTLQGMTLPVEGLTDRVIFFHDAKGRILGWIDPFGIHIEPGYAWNGCSPKHWIWPFGLVGTPDFPHTILASLFHDFLYQFAPTADFPLHRSEVDLIFYHCVAMAGAPRVARVYYDAVNRYGTWAGRPDTGVFSTLL